MSPDYSQYQGWEKVTAPNGAVYYVVPDSGYLYDPFLSNAKGRPVLFTDPRPAVEKRRQEEDRIKKASSPASQLTQLGAGTAAAVAAPLLINQLSPATATSLAGPGQVLMSDGTIKAVGAAAQGAQAAATTGQAFTQGAGVATPEMISATSVPGGAAPAASLGYAPYVGAAGAALGAYGVYDAIQNGDTMGGVMSGAGMGAGLAAASPFLMGAGPVGWGVLGAGALGGALLGGGLTSAFGSKKEFQQEQKRLQKLKDDGYNVGDILTLEKGRSKDELIKAAEASGDQASIDFAKTRDEKFLTAPQIQGYASVYERVGKAGTPAERLAAAQNAVDAQAAGFSAIKEHHGTIDVDWDKVDEWKKSGAVPAPAIPTIQAAQPIVQGNPIAQGAPMEAFLAASGAKGATPTNAMLPMGGWAAPGGLAQLPNGMVNYTQPAGAVPMTPAPAPVAVVPARSSTLSPGIGLDGKRIGYELAKRMNARSR